MELSRLAAIKRMVEEDMGVGIVPLQSVREEVEQGKLVAMWIEGAQINWELGLARLHGGYNSPISETFIKLCQEHFKREAPDLSARQRLPRPKKARRKETAAK